MFYCTYQIFFSYKAEEEAIDGTKIVFGINHVKDSQHPFDEKNL